MDLENQKRVLEYYEQYGKDDLVILLGAAEGEKEIPFGGIKGLGFKDTLSHKGERWGCSPQTRTRVLRTLDPQLAILYC